MIGAKGRRGSGSTQLPGTSSSPGSGRPIVLKGIPGSHGLAMGPTIVMGPISHAFVRRTIRQHEVDVEVQRFGEAVAHAQEGIRQVVERVQSGPARTETAILEAYVQMLGDE
ncbi:MAG TPA: phosphoenolpyruvate-utilizing N-terminal domain-containing protein, partial [Polyangiaceae bacterium]